MKLSAFLIILSAIILSGCNPQELFSQLAVSDVEQSAQEKINQSDAIKKKIETIETNKQTFAQTAELGLVQPDMEAGAFAFRNNFSLDQKTNIAIEAILPNADNKFYEAWLVGEDSDNYLSIGALSYIGPEDYQLIYSSADDTSNFPKVMITTETIADDTPEERLLIGTFNPPISE
jgi:hypothetical protein